jgi:hypothetical protein
LKSYVAKPGDLFETTVDGFIIDVQRGDLLIEVQTRLFSAIKSKLYKLTQNHPVQLVYPISKKKWIVRPSKGDDPSSVIYRRKSPNRGSPIHIFAELVSFPKLISNPNFSIQVYYIHEEEVRHWVGRKAWRRKGWGILHRTLLEVVDEQCYTNPCDFAALLPVDLPESFTTQDLAAYCQCRNRLAGRMAYCLREMGVIELIGKRGRAYLYQKVN